MISFNSKTNTFRLDTPRSTYCIFINERGYIGHAYYGSKIGEDDIVINKDTRTIDVYVEEPVLNIEYLPEETEFFSTSNGLLTFGEMDITPEMNAQLETSAKELLYESVSKDDTASKEAEKFAELSIQEIFEPIIVAAVDAAVSEAADQEIPENFSTAEIKCGDEYYSLKQSENDNKNGRLVARTVTITDVTEYHEHMLAEKQLSLEQERTRIAQEMHDSAGHTFTMISALARLLRSDMQSENNDIAAALEKISEIDGLSRSGVTQLRCTINNLRDQAFMTSVTNAIQSVITAIRGVEVDLCIQGDEDERYQFCIREIYENCRETITNTLRYSNADKIGIILKFLPERIELHILDNGNGCDNIEEHNGLQGIRSRTEKLGGEVKFMSMANEGFHTSIRIPVREVQI